MNEHRPILCLWGFMGTGKSTVGALVAAAHDAAFVDLDESIEAVAGKTISAIFAEDGESSFRALERSQLREALEADTLPLVIALGGGALVDPASHALALERAFVVTLTASVPYILERTRDDDSRPLLADAAIRASKVERLLTERRDAYQTTHWSVETDDRIPLEVSEHILKRWHPATD